MEKEKKKVSSQSYEKKKQHIKTARQNAKRDGKTKLEITGLKETEKANFTALKNLLSVTNPILLIAMVEFCKDSNEFKAFVRDKESTAKNNSLEIV